MKVHTEHEEEFNLATFYHDTVNELNVKVPNFTTHILNLGFPILTKKTGTAAVWGEKIGKETTIIFGVNPEWITTLTPTQFATICAHETLHRVLGHIVAQNASHNPQLYNIAADLVINDYLVSVLEMEVVPGLLYGKDVIGSDCSWLTVSEVLVMLEILKVEARTSCEFLHEFSGNEDPPESEESTTSAGQPKLGSDDRNGTTLTAEELDEFLAETQGSLHESVLGELPDNFTENPNSYDSPETQGYGYSLAENNLSFRKENVLSEGLQLKWKELLEQVEPEIFKGKSNAKYIRSWHTKPRKTAWLETSIPHIRRDERGKLKKKQGKPNFVLAVDTSGSIPHSVVLKLIAFAKSIPKNKVDVDVIGFNTKVYPLDVDNPKVQSGGTSFQAVQNYLKQKYDKYPKLVVVLTDGRSSFSNPPSLEERESWRWLLTTNYRAYVPPFTREEMLKLSDYAK